MSDELRLYKLLTDTDEDDFNYIQEMGWINDEEFCVWINYVWIDDFMRELKDIFGYGIFDDGGFDANMQHHCACIDLCKAIGDSIDIENMFPKNKYQH